MKLETTKSAASNFLQQQGKFDDTSTATITSGRIRHSGCNARPNVTSPSTRPYQGLPELDCPLHDKTVSVTTCGRICFIRQKINLSQIFAGQNVGIKQVSDRIWLVNFMDYNLGHVDNETCRLEPVENPFGSKVLPMPPL